MKKSICSLLLLLTIGVHGQTLTEAEAMRLARMPLHCIITEYPNKTGHMIEGPDDATLKPSQLHPAFYGCLDWHSSVHGHWLMVKVLKLYPTISNRDSIVGVLSNSFRSEKMAADAAYFTKYKNASSFERTYGWAWVLKLDQELMTWNDPLAAQWHESLKPLANQVVQLWKKFLPKQTYPNRTGVHPNTAFGLVFALDWSRQSKDTAFERKIIGAARTYYYAGAKTPAYMEPDGSDFLSPSLEIADLMRRILPDKQFATWLHQFYQERSIKRIIEMPVVSDRTDMQIVHLDGLALSRAWCMKGIAKQLPAGDAWKKLFSETATKFLTAALPNVTSGNYSGDHWLASFALYALSI